MMSMRNYYDINEKMSVLEFACRKPPYIQASPTLTSNMDPTICAANLKTLVVGHDFGVLTDYMQ
jgi:hypothetical protein